jgi:hypothetical protein
MAVVMGRWSSMMTFHEGAPPDYLSVAIPAPSLVLPNHVLPTSPAIPAGRRKQESDHAHDPPDSHPRSRESGEEVSAHLRGKTNVRQKAATVLETWDLQAMHALNTGEAFSISNCVILMDVEYCASEIEDDEGDG